MPPKTLPKTVTVSPNGTSEGELKRFAPESGRLWYLDKMYISKMTDNGSSNFNSSGAFSLGVVIVPKGISLDFANNIPSSDIKRVAQLGQQMTQGKATVYTVPNGFSSPTIGDVSTVGSYVPDTRELVVFNPSDAGSRNEEFEFTLEIRQVV
jgi:hypothetical protein